LQPAQIVAGRFKIRLKIQIVALHAQIVA
jgi:hypothetical protein